MIKYIPLEPLVAEINKRIMDAPINNIGHQRVWAYNDVKDIIDTLEVKEVQEEPVSEEFEKKFISFVNATHDNNGSYSLHDFAQRLYNIAKEELKESVSDDLEEEIIRYIGFPQEVDEEISTTMIRKAAHHFAKWGGNHVKKSQKILYDSKTCKKNGDFLTYSESDDLEEAAVGYCGGNKWTDARVRTAFIEGAQWQKEQFEKNRLAACDAQTPEEAEREMNFATNIIEKEHRTPTYDDAIKYGMRLQKEEMMAKAIDAQCFGFQGAALFSFRLPTDKYLVGSKVKVIVVKEE